MSFPRLIVGAMSVAAMLAVLPAPSHAQATRRTACNDGSTTSSVGSKVCDGHGGINKGKTAVLNRAPKDSHPEIKQAGTPAPAAQPKPRYEERRGWRWQRHHDEARPVDKHRVKCHDGRWMSAEGKSKKDVCRHHGGLAR
ncbi:MAG TPA: hypothetical protein VH539_02440 [Gemmatimonadaceae bacterium]|jgi:hypothetical protein